MSTAIIENIKEEVKSHTIVPFSAKDIACENDRLIIHDRYSVRDNKPIMDALGIRTNLSKDIFAKPQENWDTIRTALNNIDKHKRFSCIVDKENTVADVTESKVKEPTQLNYDERLDNLMDAILSSSDHAFTDAIFNPVTCQVSVNSVRNDQVDCGLGDIWKFGTTTNVGHNSQQFASFFLRLICTNGMTTKEKIAYRIADVSRNIGKQFMKFAGDNTFMGAIKPRVDKLRNSRASLYEVNSVADCLDKKEKELFMPQYASIANDFENAGHKIESINAKRQRFTYTDENLYDIFNLATNLASHQRDVLSAKACMSLNKAAADMFTHGPNIDFSVLDIYSRN